MKFRLVEERIHAVIKGEERPQVFIGGKVKLVRDAIDWFNCNSEEEMCKELEDIYSDPYYDGCIVTVDGRGWKMDGKDFLAQCKSKDGLNESWTDKLNGDVYRRLCACKSRKSDIEPLVNAKWAAMREAGKDKKGFTREDALVSVLELLDENGCDIDLTRDEYDEILA